jgi:hypothetical protein
MGGWGCGCDIIGGCGGPEPLVAAGAPTAAKPNAPPTANDDGAGVTAGVCNDTDGGRLALAAGAVPLAATAAAGGGGACGLAGGAVAKGNVVTASIAATSCNATAGGSVLAGGGRSTGPMSTVWKPLLGMGGGGGGGGIPMVVAAAVAVSTDPAKPGPVFGTGTVRCGMCGGGGAAKATATA